MQFEELWFYFAYLWLDLLSDGIDGDLYMFMVGAGEVGQSVAEVGDLSLLCRHNGGMVFILLDELLL